MLENNNNDLKYVKPFLKWAGGKTQLLTEFERRLPGVIKDKNAIKSYVEPFVGGGALFFYLKRNYDIEESYLFDINKELILAYKTIKTNNTFISLLAKLLAIADNKYVFPVEYFPYMYNPLA